MILKRIFFILALLLVKTVYGQETIKLGNETFKNISGKWKGQKIEQYSNENKLEIKRYRHKLLLNTDSTYFWHFLDKKEKGKWTIDIVSDSIQMLDFESQKGVSKGAVYIYRLTKKTMVLRMYAFVGNCQECNNSIDFFFVRK